jgi:signal peptidase I
MTHSSVSSWRHAWPALVVSTLARFVLGTLVLLVAVSVVPRVAGWESSVVMSGSMQPTLAPGDLVVVRPADAAELTRGRIVLVDDPDVPGELRMHRIAGVENGMLRLKGDANPSADGSLVAPSAVHGVGTLRLPDLGLPVVWAAQDRIAPLAATAAGLAALVLLALLYRSDRDDAAAAEAGEAGEAAHAVHAVRPRRRLVRRRVWQLLGGWRLPVPVPAPRDVFRVVAIAGVGVLLIGLPGAGGARAVFNSVSANPASSVAANTYWNCGSAATSAGATQYYPLQETAGTTAVNKGSAGSAANATYSATGVSYAVGPGPRCAVGQQSAVWLDGASGAIAANNAVTNPTTFTEQIWFATNTTSGGKLMGFGSSQTGASGNYDRHIWMLNSGQLAFGVYDGSATHAITSTAAYNDSRWHLATATFSGTAGMTLYVDGVQVARDSTSKTAQNFTGYWRIGYDNLNNWPNTPTSPFFMGAVAHAAVFPTVLSASAVADQYDAAPWSCADAAGPQGAGAAVYLPLQETSGTTAANAGTAGAAANGTYASTGVTHPLNAPNCGTNVFNSAQLDGVNGQIWTTQPVANPQTFTEQIWFATTSTTGGKLIGFGTAVNGAQSSNYDRHIYMSNTGTLTFGLYNGGYYTAVSPGAYNNGAWHLATASFSPSTGMRLYVDGALVGTNTQTTAAESETGYWRIGFDSLSGWPNAPTSFHFTGSLAHASVYYRVLTADEIAGQYLAGK